MEFSKKIIDIAAKAEKDLADVYARIDAISYENTTRVLDAFKDHRVSEAML